MERDSEVIFFGTAYVYALLVYAKVDLTGPSYEPVFGCMDSHFSEYFECNFDLERWIKLRFFFLEKKNVSYILWLIHGEGT